MNVRIDLDEPKILAKVQNDRFGTFVAKSWKTLIDPYTPRDTGLMQDTAEIQPFKIIYRGAKTSNGKYYAKYVYLEKYAKDFNFQKKNPYSTYEWDKAAANAGQLDKLTRTLNNALRSGQY
jgi:hypothetical protein